ncbi:MAG TPA: MaoC family dehydratase [Methylomirabilota bacterium]
MTPRVCLGKVRACARRGGRVISDDRQLYFDDFTVGSRYPGSSRTLGDAHFLFFAGMTGDNHPIHYDDDYARQTRFGGRVAHGLLLMGLTALGASSLSSRLEKSMIAFAEQGCRFLKPVLVGDTVRSEFRVVSVDRKGDRGVVRFGVTLTNQRNEIVLEGHHVYLLRCR